MIIRQDPARLTDPPSRSALSSRCRITAEISSPIHPIPKTEHQDGPRPPQTARALNERARNAISNSPSRKIPAYSSIRIAKLALKCLQKNLVQKRIFHRLSFGL